MSNASDTYRSTGRRFPGGEISGPAQFLPKELIDQVRDRSPLPECHPIQNFANVELQPHELNVHESPCEPCGSSRRFSSPFGSFYYATCEGRRAVSYHR